MEFKLYGKEKAPSLLLIPGLGVSFEIFLPLTELLKDRFHIIAAGIDGYDGGLPFGDVVALARLAVAEDLARQLQQDAPVRKLFLVASFHHAVHFTVFRAAMQVSCE